MPGLESKSIFPLVSGRSISVFSDLQFVSQFTAFFTAHFFIIVMNLYANPPSRNHSHILHYSTKMFVKSCIFHQNVIPVLGSDVIYSEGAVLDLLSTLRQLCGCETTVFLAGELRNGNDSLFYL